MNSFMKNLRLNHLCIFLFCTICFSSCWLDTTTSDDEKFKAAKTHLRSTDEIISTERGGYYIVRDKTTKKYYRVSSTGDRYEVIKQRY